MTHLHGVAGLPRSGSTLFCNILNQHPQIAATSTSALPAFVSGISEIASGRIETKNLLQRYPDETIARLRGATAAFCAAWHSPLGKPIVFDKSRGWTRMARTFSEINPNGAIIVMVRDLRAVFGSIEKQNAKSGLLRNSPDTLADRFAANFAPDGVIGAPYRWVVSLLDTEPSNVFYIRYEDFVANPAAKMAEVYSVLGIDPHDHDFDNVENTAIDPDGFYLHKYPHQGSGKVEAREPDWPDWVPVHIAQNIMKSAQQYNEFFKYR